MATEQGQWSGGEEDKFVIVWRERRREHGYDSHYGAIPVERFVVERIAFTCKE
jgi:hypothetical protein